MDRAHRASTQAPGLLQRLRTWLRSWPVLNALCWLVVLLLISSVPATLEAVSLKLLDGIVPEQYWTLLLLTAPLTCSVAIASLGWFRGWFAQAGLLPMCLLVLAGGSLGRVLGLPGAAEPEPWLPAGEAGSGMQILFGAINQLAGFLGDYGVKRFAAALIVGVWAGYSVHGWLKKPAEEAPRESDGNDASVRRRSANRKAA